LVASSKGRSPKAIIKIVTPRAKISQGWDSIGKAGG